MGTNSLNQAQELIKDVVLSGYTHLNGVHSHCHCVISFDLLITWHWMQVKAETELY